METHEAVMDGVTAVELEPQELRIAAVAVNPNKKRTRSQRTLSRPKRKFDSRTRNPPARTTPIFLRNIRSLFPRGLPAENARRSRDLATARRARTDAMGRASDAKIRRNTSVCRQDKFQACR